MIFLWVIIAVVLLLAFVALWNWWRDEQERLGKLTRRYMPRDIGNVIPSVTSSTPLHPSIDPYLAELRAELLRDPLPNGPGEMASRAYAHLNQWLTVHANDSSYGTGYDFVSDASQEIEDEPQYINMSRNNPVPPPGYLEHIMDGINDNQ